MTRRVLHVLASNDRRGAEVFAVDLARALDDHGWTSTLVSTSTSTSTATVPARPLRDGTVARLRELRRLARAHDVVVAHGSTSLPACAVTCVGVAPFVYRSIGDPSYWSSTGLRRLRTKAMLDRAHTVVALFDAAADELCRRGIRARIEVVPNAVRSDGFPAVTSAARHVARAELGLRSDEPVVLYLGALSREKRPDRAAALARARPDLRVLVVGDGPLRGEVDREAAAVSNLTVHGPTDSPGTVLAAADVVIVPSDTEGIPGAAIEAGFSGLPVVASDVGGLSAVVDHGVTGLLAPAGDDDALARAVDEAYQRRSELGAAARERCLERFDIGAVAERWAQVIDRAARPRTGA